MKLITLCFLLLSLKLLASPVVTLTTDMELDSYIKKSGFNGVVLVAKNKDTLFKKAYGYKNFETLEPLTINDRFQIGSNTKQFVAAALLKLQEEGKLSLDDEIVKYLPEYGVLQGIKIRDVINHTSGISNYSDHDEFFNDLEYSKTLSLSEIISFALKFPFDFEARSQWNYSNTGYIIAGKILEVVTGKSWDQVIQGKFLNPLSMSDTGYNPFFKDVSDVSGHMMIRGSLTPFNEFNLSWAGPAGALYSTLDDLLKWTSIYEDSNLLSEASKKDMQTPFLAQYALGLMIKNYHGETCIRHTGRTLGFVSSINFLKESKLKIITLDNVDGNTLSPFDILASFYFEGKAVVPKMEFYENTVDLSQFVGEYGSATDFGFKIFIQNGKLFLKTTFDDQRPYELTPNDLDSFRYQGVFAEEFLRDEQGNVVGVNYYQNGKVKKLSKVK